MHLLTHNPGKMPKSYYDRTVEKTKALEGCATIRLKGLNPSEFQQRFKYAPQDLGFKLRDLVYPSMNNTKYKGVLVRNDGSFGELGVDYDFTMKLSLQDTETFLDSANHIHQGQADKIVTYLSCPSQAEDQMWKDLRNCNHTVQYRLKDFVTLRSASEFITYHSFALFFGQYLKFHVVPT